MRLTLRETEWDAGLPPDRSELWSTWYRATVQGGGYWLECGDQIAPLVPPPAAQDRPGADEAPAR